MSKRLFQLGTLALAMAVGTGVAYADVSAIDLASTLLPATFTGEGSSVQLNLGNCLSSTCDMNGVGVAVDGTTQTASTWDLGSTQNTIDLTYANGTWSFSASAPITFYFGLGGSLLTGEMSLSKMAMSAASNSLMTQYGVAGNFDATGGQYASNFGPALANVGLKFLFLGSVDLTSLLGAANVGKQFSATLMVGQITPSQTPESASVWLTGGGLMLLGTILRLRRGHGRQQRS